MAATHDSLSFDAPAKAIAAADRVYIVGRDGREQELVRHTYPNTPLKIQQINYSPFSDTQTKVEITFSPPAGDGVCREPSSGQPNPTQPVLPGGTNPAVNPWVVVIGGKVFGLSDAPFFAQSPTTITLLASTDLLRSSSRIDMRLLLWQPGASRIGRPLGRTALTQNRPI